MMDQNLTYQKARTIRGTKLTDVLSDQLLYEKSVTKAVGKTISIKTQAGIKGIKEKFDPLNIARFLTGGSKLAPALLGRLTGRNIRDIEYFTGRNRPVRIGASTASRITPLSGGDGDIEGINEQLLKIYNFLKLSTSSDIKRREKEQNFAEERELESQRRHKEFLEVLQKITGKKTATVTEQKTGGGLLDGLSSMVQGIVGKVLDGIEWLKDLKSLLSLRPLLMFMRSPIFALLTNPAVLMVGSILGLAYLLKKYVDTVPDYSKLTPEEAKNVLENGSPKDIEKFGGREKLMKIAIGGKEEAQRILDEQTELTPEERTKYEKIAGVEVKEQTATQLRPVSPRPDENKGLAGRKKAEKWDMEYGDTHNPDGSPKVKMPAQPLPQGMSASTPEQAAEVRRDFAAGDPRRIDLPQGAAFGVKPKGIPTVNDRLNKVMSENVDANLPTKSESQDKGVMNNIMNNSGKNKIKLDGLDEIAVHNDEPTFLRMIINSTRIV